MGQPLAERILSVGLHGEARAGDVVIAEVDLTFVQDATGPLTIRQFKEIGFKAIAKPEQTAILLDQAALRGDDAALSGRKRCCR